MTDLYHLAYISKNAINGPPEAVEAEIRDILRVAQRNNPAKGVTGALLFSGGYFCQVIEGPLEALEDLFETIQMDARHSNAAVLHFEPIQQRGFQEWAMALAGIEDSARFDIESIRASKDELAMAESGRHLVTVLEQLVSQHQKTIG